MRWMCIILLSLGRDYCCLPISSKVADLTTKVSDQETVVQTAEGEVTSKQNLFDTAAQDLLATPDSPELQEVERNARDALEKAQADLEAAQAQLADLKDEKTAAENKMNSYENE